MNPTPRCLWLFSLGFPVALLPALVAPSWTTAWVAFLGLAVFAAGCDAILCLPPRRIQLDATPPPGVLIGTEETLSLRFSAPRSRFGVTVEVVCEFCPLLVRQPAVKVTIPAGAAATLHVPIIAHRRGTARLNNVWLRWSGPLGLMRRTSIRATRAQIPVTPNLLYVRSAALEFLDARQFQSGMKAVKYLGDGSEFESLREFLPGFDSRAIDWKASARHRTLLCREHRAERNHQILFALDTGHLMGEPIDGVPRLDHAIHTSLVLGLVAIKAGDRVGLCAFDDQPRTYLEPTGGMQAYHRIQRRTSELDYSSAETNFTLGLMELSRRLRRRSLIVVLTEFVDSVTAELLIENLGRLSGRHLILFVALRDPSLISFRDRAPETTDDLNRSVVAGDLLRERDILFLRLKRLGIHCIDAAWQEVSSKLLNRYIEIKRRGMI
ncbi:MAG: DUF58 domain-containing protein [Planctomycetota bacterium]